MDYSKMDYANLSFRKEWHKKNISFEVIDRENGFIACTRRPPDLIAEEVRTAVRTRN